MSSDSDESLFSNDPEPFPPIFDNKLPSTSVVLAPDPHGHRPWLRRIRKELKERHMILEFRDGRLAPWYWCVESPVYTLAVF